MDVSNTRGLSGDGGLLWDFDTALPHLQEAAAQVLVFETSMRNAFDEFSNIAMTCPEIHNEFRRFNCDGNSEMIGAALMSWVTHLALRKGKTMRHDALAEHLPHPNRGRD